MRIEQKSRLRFRCGFALLLFAVAAFRMWFSNVLPLSGDEAYHWEWSRNLASGYYDHPPLTAWIIWFSTSIFGMSSEFAVRLPAVILLACASVAAYVLAFRVAESRYGASPRSELAGFLAGVLVIFIPLFAFLSIYISTDPALVFAWIFLLLSLDLALEKRGTGWWVMAGVAAGIAVLSKFLVAHLFAAFAMTILLKRERRKLFLDFRAWCGVLVALLIVMPFLMWNSENDWATFRFNLQIRQIDNHFTFDYFPEFIGGQMLVLSPIFFLLALRDVWKSLRDPCARESALFLPALSAAIGILYFVWISFRRRVGIHWPAGGWISAIIVFAVVWADVLVSGSQREKKLRSVSFVLCVVFTVLLHVLPSLPTSWIEKLWHCETISSRFERDDLFEQYGWYELGEQVALVREQMAQNATGVAPFIITPQYGLSALISFYTPGQPKSHLWTKRRTHGENYRYWDDYSELKGYNAVFVAKTDEHAVYALYSLKEHFMEVEKIEEFPVHYGNQKMRSFFYIRCKEYDGKEPFFE